MHRSTHDRINSDTTLTEVCACFFNLMEQLTYTLLPQRRTRFHTDIQSVGKLSDFLGHEKVFLDLFSYSLLDLYV